MRLERYLIEAVDKNFVLDEVRTKCGKWIKEIGFPIYRGIESGLDVVWKTPRTDRQPLSLYQNKHDVADTIFKKEFGYRARSESVLVTTDIHHASEFGSYTYMVFPVGNFKYLYSNKVKDFIDIGIDMKYVVESRPNNSVLVDRLDRMLGLDDERAIKSFEKFLIDNYTDKGLKNNVNEVMLKCDHYVGLRINGDYALFTEEELIKELF